MLGPYTQLVNWDEDSGELCDEDDENDIPNNYFPAKMLASFVVTTDKETNKLLTEEQCEQLDVPLCLIHSTQQLPATVMKNDPIGDSTLTRKYHLEYDRRKKALLRVVAVDTIEDHAFVVESLPGVHEYINSAEERSVRLCLDRQKTWSSFFNQTCLSQVLPRYFNL